MKILAMSHSCVTDVNQQLFVRLNQLPDTQVEVIVPSQWRNDYTGKMEEPRTLAGVDFPLHHLPIAVPGHVSLHFYRSLPLDRFRRFGPDVVLSAQEPWSLSGWQALRLSRTLGVPFAFQTNQNLDKRYPPPFRWIEQTSYRHAAVALAYSEEARQVMVRKGRTGPSAVVPYGTDLSLFRAADRSALRQSLGVAGSVVIGYMGRLVPEKGLDTLIEAAEIIQRERPALAFQVMLVGSGPDEPRLRQLVDAAGLRPRFVFTGAVPHTQAGEYMGCFDVFALPSRTTPRWKEQFGRVIIEAMACGVPVVGSDSGEIPRLIETTNGGLVFREGDAADLAARLLALLEDPTRRRQTGEAGRQSVTDRYSYEAVAAALRAALQDACASRPAAAPHREAAAR